MTKDLDFKHVYALILCGGGGTRLWPVSTNKTPKQFLKLIGDRTFFQHTVDRNKRLIPEDRTYVVTVSREYAEIVHSQAPGIPLSNIIIEPLRRNTLMAHAVGAAYITHVDPEAVILNLASDHIIVNTIEYIKTIKTAVTAAAVSGQIVTIGIKPTKPHIGYGYIQSRQIWNKYYGSEIKTITRFHEKLSLKTAEKYLKTKNYYWNANLFTWRGDVFLKTLKRHLPKTAMGIKKIKGAIGTSQEKTVLRGVYQMIQPQAIEKAVIEKEKRMLMVEANFNWTDIGDWQGVHHMIPKDKNQNVTLKPHKSKTYLINTTDTLIKSDKKIFVMIGIDNLVVIETPLVLLICKKSDSELVKTAINLLKADHLDQF